MALQPRELAQNDAFGCATLDQNDEQPWTFDKIPDTTQAPKCIPIAGKEVGLDTSSDNSAVLLVAIDVPAVFKRLLPGQVLQHPTRFERIWVQRPTSVPSDPTKTYYIASSPRTGGLQFPTTPTPSVSLSGTGASAQQTQGTAANGAAAVGNPNEIAGLDNAGNVRAVNVTPAGSAGGANPNTLVAGGIDIGYGPTGNSPAATGAVYPVAINSDASATPLRVLGVVPMVYNAAAKLWPLNGANEGQNQGTTPVVLNVGGRNGQGTPAARGIGVANEGEAAFNNSLLVGGYDSGTLARALRSSLATTVMSLNDYLVEVRNVPSWIGAQANAWNNAAVGANGTSAALDTAGHRRIEVFGNTSAASTISLQVSQDNSTWYDATATTGVNGNSVAANGNFNLSFDCGARYVRLKSSAAVTITATIAAKG